MRRIQRKGLYDWSWKENPNAVYVGRPSKWGNPFKVRDYGLEKCLSLYRKYVENKLKTEPDFLEPLRGKDLVCWCPLDKPCHADILLELANKKER
jgi:hypothetical protein